MPDGAPISGLGRAAADLRQEVAAIDDLTVTLDPGATPKQLRRALSNATEEPINLTPWVTAEAIDGLKFSQFLPSRLASQVVTRRLADPESIARALDERLIGCAIQADDVFGVIDFPSRGLLKQTLLALRGGAHLAEQDAPGQRRASPTGPVRLATSEESWEWVKTTRSDPARSASAGELGGRCHPLDRGRTTIS